MTMNAQKAIMDLGYAFNADGQLRKLDENGQPGDQPFEFFVSEYQQECQAKYEELGAAITEYIYHLLEKEEGLIRLSVPKGSTRENGTFIFVSKDYDKKDVLMILIHGSGPVRAGQWARSLIINDSLQSGSQIPYIRQALHRGYGIMILNGNDNMRDGKNISHCSTPGKHAFYVWDKYVAYTKASSIVIVGHSYGGAVTVLLADKYNRQFKKRVKVVALTDSVHNYIHSKITKHLKKISRNWLSNPQPLDTVLKTPAYDLPRVSAGHSKHEMTSFESIHSVFIFIEERLNNVK